MYSAGPAPSSVNRYAIRAMRERGIDISSQSSDHLDLYLKREFDYAITVCDHAAESCPIFPGRARRIHWSFPDHAAAVSDDNAVIQSFIHARDGLDKNLSDWLKTAT